LKRPKVSNKGEPMLARKIRGGNDSGLLRPRNQAREAAEIESRLYNTEEVEGYRKRGRGEGKKTFS